MNSTRDIAVSNSATPGYGAAASYGFFYWYGFFGPPRGSSRNPAS